MLLSGHSNFLLRIFSIIGIAPYARLPKIGNPRTVSHLIPMITSSIFSLSLTIFLLIFPHFESLGPIHTIINFSYVWSLFLTISSANFQCHFYRAVYHRANQRIRQIQKKLSAGTSATKFSYQFQCRFRIKLLAIFVLFFASQGLVFIEVWLISETRGLWSSLTASLVTSTLRIFYPMHIFHIMLHCDVLTMFIRNLNVQAQNLSMRLSATDKVEFLKSIKSMHMELWKLIFNINKFFGWNLLFLMINSFIYISYQLYWIFLSFQLHWGLLAIISKST